MGDPPLFHEHTAHTLRAPSQHLLDVLHARPVAVVVVVVVVHSIHPREQGGGGGGGGGAPPK
jgi:hypothetical protein